jgi:hypothetical protein
VLGALLCVADGHSQQFEQKSETGLDKTLHALSWPAYSFAPKNAFVDDDQPRLDRTEEFVLAGERLGFAADATTTELGLGHGEESDPLNTLFGSKSKAGVLGSMTAWELGFSYTSVVVPLWFEHTRFRKVASIAAVAGGSVLTGFRVRMAVRNSQFAQ